MISGNSTVVHSYSTGSWTPEEISALEKILLQVGKDWEVLCAGIPTR